MVGVGIFFILAIVAGILAFGGTGGVGVPLARILFFVFLLLLVTSAVAVGFARVLARASIRTGGEDSLPGHVPGQPGVGTVDQPSLPKLPRTPGA